MAQSIFAANATQYIDALDADSAPAGLWNLGAQYVGGSKTFLRRCLGGFDLHGPAASGRPLVVSDTITAAELILEATAIVGPVAWGAKVERNTRLDWDYTSADWARYRVGANWTTGGGDVATPPAAVTFTSPAATGEQIIAGMLAFVTDAIANRGGKVLLRLKADDEVPAQTQWVGYDALLTSSLRPRLRVTYTAADPSPIDDPHGPTFDGARLARPDGAALADSPSGPEAAERPQMLILQNESRVQNELKLRNEPISAERTRSGAACCAKPKTAKRNPLEHRRADDRGLTTEQLTTVNCEPRYPCPPPSPPSAPASARTCTTRTAAPIGGLTPCSTGTSPAPSTTTAWRRRSSRSRRCRRRRAAAI
jgi:hypothetical protein